MDYPTGPFTCWLAVGDFNGDGKLDLVTANYQNPTGAIVLLGNGDGTFQPGVSYSTSCCPTYVAVGDFNGDGKLDLVATTGSAVSVLLGNGDGTFQPPMEFATSVQ